MGKKGKEKKRKERITTELLATQTRDEKRATFQPGFSGIKETLGERLWKPFLVDDIQDLIYPWVTSVFFS